MISVDDTIVAIASPPGGAARGIVRLSGPDAVACMASIFRSNGSRPLSAIRTPQAVAGLVNLDEPSQASLQLPADLFIWPNERSYTRQPTVEVHTFGSPPLLEAVVQSSCRQGARLALPGEFTMRAFLAGRLDLAQAEAVLGVIQAQHAHQLDAALHQLAGGLSRPLHLIRTELIDLLAELEAGLDFVEEDIEFIAPEKLLQRLAESEQVVSTTLRQMTQREYCAGTLRAVLTGRPNAGKSSLFNALHKRCAAQPSVRALVSAQPGTTRDYLTSRIDTPQCSFDLIDTAGLGPEVKNSLVGVASGRTAHQQLLDADLLLECVDAPAAILGEVRDTPVAQSTHPPRWLVLTKADLVTEDSLQGLGQRRNWAAVTSSRDGRGLDELIQRITEFADERVSTTGMVAATTAARCRDSLHRAGNCLATARQLVESREGDELVAVELREALYEIGLVVGAVYTDDILDRVFSRFCIGK